MALFGKKNENENEAKPAEKKERKSFLEIMGGQTGTVANKKKAEAAAAEAAKPAAEPVKPAAATTVKPAATTTVKPAATTTAKPAASSSSTFTVKPAAQPAQPAAKPATFTVKPAPAGKSVEELAKEVIQGKWGNGADRKAALEKEGFDYDKVQAKVNELLSGAPAAGTKSVEELAKEVIQGKWGNGADRKAALEKAGYSYDEVQAKVNALMSGAAPAAPAGKSIEEVAREVIQGKWGNGADRKAALEKAGYDYNAVQAKVNQLLK